MLCVDKSVFRDSTAVFSGLPCCGSTQLPATSPPGQAGRQRSRAPPSLAPPRSFCPSGGFTEAAKKKVLAMLGFQNLHLEKSTWCVYKRGRGEGGGWLRGSAFKSAVPIPRVLQSSSPLARGGHNGLATAGLRAWEGAGESFFSAYCKKCHFPNWRKWKAAARIPELPLKISLCLPSEGTGAFPGSDIYRMVEQVDGQLKDSVTKVLEEER